MSAAPLENHITPVPVCHSQERLAAAIARLSPQDDWLLLWDERPVGALPVATLCHRFLSVDKAESQQDWRQFLDTPIEALLQRPDIEQRLQPLQLIPVFWSQQDLQSYLKHSREAIAQFQWVVVDADQQPLGLLKPEILWQPAALNDEAARRVMELTAQQATLQQTWQLNNDYLAYLSHELKNPITALLGLSELLVDLQSLPDAAKEESVQQRQQRYSQLIRHNSLKLAAIASDILDLSRIEQGHLSLTRQSVALRPLCHRAWQDVHTNTGYATQFRSRPASDPALPGQDASPLTAPPDLTITALPNLEHIVADEQRLLQMLTQLLVNARIATAFSGEVGVAIAVWGPWCAITVWDTGVGIAPEHQAKLLYSLQTLENPQTHSLEETGLGLVLTQRLAERQGGDVSFLSGPDGNRFTLLLPYDRSDPADLGGTSHKSLAVVADTQDDAFTRLTQALEACGCGVVAARSGPEALGKIRRLSPQVVILNPLLPHLSGWDVLALLKADPATEDIPILLSLASAAHLPTSQADGVLSSNLPPKVLGHIISSHVAPPIRHSRPAAAQGPLSAAPELSLTLLYFNPQFSPTAAMPDLNGLLHPHGCRVIEVDDPSQASLIAQVWRPDVMLLGLAVPVEVAYLQQLTQIPQLARLPVVAFDPAIAAAGHRAGLSIYPCLVSSQALAADNSPELVLLVQVIQVAALANRRGH